MAISYAPVMPAGYFSRHSLDENGQPCISLHNEKVGWLSDHDCAADAIYAAQEREAAEAEQLADYMAQQREMDLIYRAVTRMYDADKPATDPRNFAVREVLDAIDSLGRPSAEDERRAA
jgi:hypothetical protein